MLSYSFVTVSFEFLRKSSHLWLELFVCDSSANLILTTATGTFASWITVDSLHRWANSSRLVWPLGCCSRSRPSLRFASRTTSHRSRLITASILRSISRTWLVFVVARSIALGRTLTLPVLVFRVSFWILLCLLTFVLALLLGLCLFLRLHYVVDQVVKILLVNLVFPTLVPVELILRLRPELLIPFVVLSCALIPSIPPFARHSVPSLVLRTKVIVDARLGRTATPRAVLLRAVLLVWLAVSEFATLIVLGLHLLLLLGCLLLDGLFFLFLLFSLEFDFDHFASVFI